MSPSNILAEIITRTELEVQRQKAQLPLQFLLDRLGGEAFLPSFAEALARPGIHILAEIKYQSPSHGPFQCQLPPEEIAGSYVAQGASAISVLTEPHYFQGRLEYLRRIRDRLDRETDRTPLLRKDFIVDRYQIPQSRWYGASAYLLIVAALEPFHLSDYISYGREFQLDALVEVHDPFELEEAVEAGARIVGVNNRDLRSFEVNLQTSFDLARRLEGEEGYLLVAESGISEPSQILELHDAGFNAFLIGSCFMESSDPGGALKALKEALVKREEGRHSGSDRAEKMMES